MHEQRPQHPPGPPRNSGDMLQQLAQRYYAEMDGESKIIAAFFQMMSDVAAVRRKFLEENGHLLRQLATPPGPAPDYPPPSERIPNGHDPDGAAMLANRIHNGQGRR